jgi:hypothetical protein
MVELGASAQLLVLVLSQLLQLLGGLAFVAASLLG